MLYVVIIFISDMEKEDLRGELTWLRDKSGST